VCGIDVECIAEVVGILGERLWVLEGRRPADAKCESRAGHLAMSGGFHDSGSKGEVAGAPQPHTVEAMCKANRPAQTRPTESGAERATLERAATHGLEGEPP
jgi:hypothetical protein